MTSSSASSHHMTFKQKYFPSAFAALNREMQIFILFTLLSFSSASGIACKDTEDCPDTQFCRKTLWECCRFGGVGECVDKKSDFFSDDSIDSSCDEVNDYGSLSSISSCESDCQPRHDDWPYSENTPVRGPYGHAQRPSSMSRSPRSPNIPIPKQTESETKEAHLASSPPMENSPLRNAILNGDEKSPVSRRLIRGDGPLRIENARRRSINKKDLMENMLWPPMSVARGFKPRDNEGMGI
jgi:hypothetical protein